eukprot:1892881-Prymnesium_polylepis.1
MLSAPKPPHRRIALPPAGLLCASFLYSPRSRLLRFPSQVAAGGAGGPMGVSGGAANGGVAASNGAAAIDGAADRAQVVCPPVSVPILPLSAHWYDLCSFPDRHARSPLL